MIRKFDDSEDNPDLSSIIAEPVEYKSNTLAVHKIQDSFDSSFLVRNGSESSFISQISNDDPYGMNAKPYALQVLKPYKKSHPLRQEFPQGRPASILKTTFLSEDTTNYNIPRLEVEDQVISERKKTKSFIDNSSFTSHTILKSDNKPKFADENSMFSTPKDLCSTKIEDMKNQIIKKDALIETLRMRIGKMVQELEETHRRISNIKKSENDDLIKKVQILTSKCEEYEKRTQEFRVREEDLCLIISKKEQELNYIEKDKQTSKYDYDKKLEIIQKLENALQKSEDNKKDMDKYNENLQVKLDNINKALEISNNHKNHLEQEVIRLEIIKRTQENEIKVIIDENYKSVRALTKKLDEALEESKKYQRLHEEVVVKYDILARDHETLSIKLESFEEKLNQLDKIGTLAEKEHHIRSQSSKIRAEKPANPHTNDIERQFTFQNIKERTSDISFNTTHKKTNSSPYSLRNLIREIMELLEVTNCFEIIPEIKKTISSKKEKKLVRKLANLVRECFAQDRNKDVTPAQIWRLIKKIFEDYASLKKTGNSDMNLIRQYLGDTNVVERVANLCQENKFLQVFIGKIRYKLRLQPTASINEIEAALGIY
ncbi:hypothetical protein SteCoe_34778 [Stentor coeruleus]|uniref:Uncharacterized protein n=1 Tax=Stentor coeruleus TaxID=5963 RepID=A0A1R2ATW7_9CILI|nr:hypothetical protein SteCoe_34778 [Stentor coeruleus]